MALSVPTLVRIGLWEAHGRKCAYCGEPVSYRELEIDHIIPQYLGGNLQALAELLSTLGLARDFDLNDTYNLLPAHRYCNAKKAGMVFQPQNARFYLELASKLADRVAKEAQKHLRRIRSDRLFAALQLACESGDLSSDEVARLAGLARNQDAFEVLTSVEFSSRIITGLLKRVEVAPLLDKPLLPRRHGLNELKMGNGLGERRAVKTCREWADAKNKGYQPMTNYDIHEEAFFKRAYWTIQAFSRASIADLSFVDVGQELCLSSCANSFRA